MATGQMSAVGLNDFGRRSPISQAAVPGAGSQSAAGGTRTSPVAASSRGSQLVSAAPGSPPRATETNANASIVLFDLQAGIRRAEALLQSLSAQAPSLSSRMMVAKAYSLEVQAQEAIVQLQTRAAAPTREWYA